MFILIILLFTSILFIKMIMSGFFNSQSRMNLLTLKESIKSNSTKYKNFINERVNVSKNSTNDYTHIFKYKLPEF